MVSLLIIKFFDKNIEYWRNPTSVSYLPAQSLKDEDDLQEIIPEDVSKHATSLF
jgi:hypothetical protein